MIDGLVQCDGEYMVMCGISPRGHVIFNGEIVERLHVKEGILQKIVMREGLLEIKDVV
jgi:septum site-determining protein MinC